MKQVNDFNIFLRDVVNLPQTKLDYLDDRVARVYKALKKADLGTQVLGMEKQGSWAHLTIINPRDGEEFDADFMLELKERIDWSPSDYQSPVLDALQDYCDAQGMNTDPEPKTRCVRIAYANDMHIDVVPYVKLARKGECIVNAETDEWEDTNPEGFTTWMHEKDAIANGNMRRVLRILKYLRDHRNCFEDTKSIILTTIVGERITQHVLRSHPGCYDNVPTALHRITADLANWVRDMPDRPEIEDPSRKEATFTHRWPQSEYDAFRNDIQDVAARVEAAITCLTTTSESTQKWREVLGEKFGQTEREEDSPFPATGAGGAAGVETSTGRNGRAG